MVAACACVWMCKCPPSEGAAAEGESKEPKVPAVPRLDSLNRAVGSLRSRLETPKGFQPWRVRAGGLRPRAAAAALRRRGLRAGGRRLPAAVRFWSGRCSKRRRSAAMVAACACVWMCKCPPSEGAAAEGESKEPKVPAVPRLDSLNRAVGSLRSRLETPKGFQPWRVRAGGLRPRAAAAALRRRGLRAGGRRLPAAVRFWSGRCSKRRRSAAMVAACACVWMCKCPPSAGAAAACK